MFDKKPTFREIIGVILGISLMVLFIGSLAFALIGAFVVIPKAILGTVTAGQFIKWIVSLVVLVVSFAWLKYCVDQYVG